MTILWKKLCGLFEDLHRVNLRCEGLFLLRIMPFSIF